MTQRISIQDMLPGNYCFGCGPENEVGLQIKSYRSDDGEEMVCNWQPEPHHLAGPQHILNGGIIATIMDCHSIFTAIDAAYQAEGREPGSEPEIWCVTGYINVSYLRPTRVDKPVELRGRVREINGKKIIVDCTLYSEGEETAHAETLAVRVPQEWKQRDHSPVG